MIALGLLMCCMAMLFGCNTERSQNENDTTADTVPSMSEPSSTETRGPDENSENIIKLFGGDMGDYHVINGIESFNSNESVKLFIRNIKLKTGQAVSLQTESVEETDREILIGNVPTRVESETLMAKLSYTAYMIRLEGEKIMIGLYDDALLDEALEKLMNDLRETPDGGYGLPEGYVKTKDISPFGMQIPHLAAENVTVRGIYAAGAENFQVAFQGATAVEFQEYATLLEKTGFAPYATNEIGNNRFATYIKDNFEVHLFWYEALGSFRVLYGPLSGLPVNTAPEYTAVVTPSVTQMGGDSIEEYGAANKAPGMSYVIQLADGSYVVIDGGPLNETDKLTLLNFLRDNNPNEGKPRVMWMFTHAHPDHMALANSFLTTCFSDIELIRVCYNFPDYAAVEITNEAGAGNVAKNYIAILQDAVRRYYPKAETYIFHSGDRFCLPGCELEILLTQEDYWPNTFPSVNHNSAAFRFEIEGKTFLVLGDCETGLCNQMAAVYGSYLKSDILQTTHHGKNGGSLSLYQYVDPSVCFWPVSETKFLNNAEWLGIKSGYEFNRYLREDPARRHYAASKITTILFPSLEEKGSA